MKIPKIITRDDYVYIYEKEYPNYVLYRNLKTGAKECFQRFDLIDSNRPKKVGPRCKWEREFYNE